MSQQQEKMTKEEMLARINLLSDEIDANEEENRAMQAEIDSLYARIDSLPAETTCVECGAQHAPGQNTLCSQ